MPQHRSSCTAKNSSLSRFIICVSLELNLPTKMSYLLMHMCRPSELQLPCAVSPSWQTYRMITKPSSSRIILSLRKQQTHLTMATMQNLCCARYLQCSLYSDVSAELFRFICCCHRNSLVTCLAITWSGNHEAQGRYDKKFLQQTTHQKEFPSDALPSNAGRTAGTALLEKQSLACPESGNTNV